MYIPAAFRETRPEVLHPLIRQYSFGTLVSLQDGELIASHLPFLLDAERGAHGTLRGHMARANPQWQGFRGGAEVMVIFQGPHAYVSPSWYETRLSVPTWNYAAVHAYGVPHLIEDGAELYGILKATVHEYEASSHHPWAFELPEEYVCARMKAIVGFEIPLSRLEGKLKLSQNRVAADRQSVTAALRQSGDPSAVAVAELMAAVEGRS